MWGKAKQYSLSYRPNLGTQQRVDAASAAAAAEVVEEELGTEGEEPAPPYLPEAPRTYLYMLVQWRCLTMVGMKKDMRSLRVTVDTLGLKPPLAKRVAQELGS